MKAQALKEALQRAEPPPSLRQVPPLCFPASSEARFRLAGSRCRQRHSLPAPSRPPPAPARGGSARPRLRPRPGGATSRTGGGRRLACFAEEGGVMAPDVIRRYVESIGRAKPENITCLCGKQISTTLRHVTALGFFPLRFHFEKRAREVSIGEEIGNS